MFLKDMTFAIANFDEFLEQDMLGITHTFLIRSPERALRSYYQVWLDYPQYNVTDKFNADWIVMAYIKHFQFYNFLSEKLGVQPVVIAAEDVLHNPEKMLRQYCDKTGLTYHEDMLNWKKTSWTRDRKRSLGRIS